MLLQWIHFMIHACNVHPQNIKTNVFKVSDNEHKYILHGGKVYAVPGSVTYLQIVG